MSMKKYTAALIGCGRIGFSWDFEKGRNKPAAHIGAVSENAHIRLVGAADTDIKQLHAVRTRYARIPLFKSGKELIKKTRPDMVIIATPDEHHIQDIELAASYGVRLILCEKPLATNLRDAMRGIRIAKKKGSMLIINHMRRFDPTLIALQQKIKRGIIGDIMLARALYVNGLLNNGTHTVDLLRWYMGDIAWVQGIENRHALFSHKNDYNADAMIGFRSGARGVIQSLDARQYYLFEQEFYGTKGMLSLKNLSLNIEKTPVQGQRLVHQKVIHFGDGNRSFFRSMMRHAVRCLDGVDVPRSTGEDGYRALQVLLAIRASIEAKGKKILIT